LKHGQPQMGSLAGAAQLLKHNTGVPRGAQEEQKSSVEEKAKSPLNRRLQ